MKLSILLCLCLLAQGVFSHMPTVYKFCSHVVAKTGPVGSRGIQGLEGQEEEQGTSEGLEEKVRILEESVCYMGMKSGNIPDAAITSSSEYTALHSAHLGRLDNQPSASNYGTWLARRSVVGEWVQVDVGQPEVVAGVVTQGRPRYGNQWVSSYKVSCGKEENNMTTITEQGRDKVFIANIDMETKVVNKFPQLVTCRYIRIYPQSFHGHMGMRLEIIKGICKDIC